MPLIRSNPEDETAMNKLTDLTNNYKASCFNYETYLFEYLEMKTREVNAINIFYTETIDKPAPQISQFKEAEIAEALLTKKFVFILTLNIIPNKTEELFPTEDCQNDEKSKLPSWYDDRTITGDIGAIWRDFMAFYKANYGVTQPGKVSYHILYCT